MGEFNVIGVVRQRSLIRQSSRRDTRRSDHHEQSKHQGLELQLYSLMAFEDQARLEAQVRLWCSFFGVPILVCLVVAKSKRAHADNNPVSRPIEAGLQWSIRNSATKGACRIIKSQSLPKPFRQCIMAPMTRGGEPMYPTNGMEHRLPGFTKINLM